MPGFEDCQACEFRDRPETCHAMKKGNRRWCELAHSLDRGDYRQKIHDLTLEIVPKQIEHPGVVGTVSPVPPPPPAQQARTAFRINRCLVREPLRLSCGCNKALCHRSGTPLEVSYGQCVACVDPGN